MIRLLLLCFALSAEATAFDSSDFQFFKELKSTAEDEGLARFELDPEIFANTKERFTDLRIVQVVDGWETETPYLVSRVDRYAPPESAEPIASEILSFNENPDGSLEFEVRLSGKEKEKNCATIEFETPLRNFEKNVSVQASDNGTTWQPMVGGVLIFDRERFLDFRKTSVSLPENTARIFRIRIADATDEQRSVVREISRTVGEHSGTSVTETATVATRAFRIDQLKFLTAEKDESETEAERTYPSAIIDRTENPETHCTELLLESSRAPVNSLTIVSPDKNFRREVCVQIAQDSGTEGWRTIKRSRVHRYHIGNFHDENLSIGFDTTRAERFRILIENGDSPALSVDGIVATGDRYEALFLTEPNSDWRVYYGSIRDDLGTPRYDTAALGFATARGIAASGFEFGGEKKNPGYHKRKTGPGWAKQEWVLWLVIAIVVSGLLVVLFKTGQKIEENE